jgi:hypothetical protein
MALWIVLLIIGLVCILAPAIDGKLAPFRTVGLILCVVSLVLLLVTHLH